jgi:hypothetical protein
MNILFNRLLVEFRAVDPEAAKSFSIIQRNERILILPFIDRSLGCSRYVHCRNNVELEMVAGMVAGMGVYEV